MNRVQKLNILLMTIALGMNTPLVAAVAGWGGLPAKAASYIVDSFEQNDGKTPHSVTVKDVPVDAFWSVTVKYCFYCKNKQQAYDVDVIIPYYNLIIRNR